MSTQTTSLFWYDLETFGIDPARDRIGQFAGIRTDLDFNPIGEPIDIRCAPTWDTLPDPDACAITGVTPMDCLDGLCENDFAETILKEFTEPGTCVVGYNNLRFDDEFVRHLLYRNLRDPYAREWQNNCSRWDLLDVVRLCRALRPEGIEWPFHEDGRPSNKLEDLSSANNLEHAHAHDALSDVRATIAVAKMLSDKHPKLYNYVFDNRSKQGAGELLDLHKKLPVVHVSGMLPSAQGHTSIVMPLGQHPSNKNGIIVCDLTVDPDSWVNLGVDTIKERLYTRTADLPEGIIRPPIKTVHINKTPILAPLGVLNSESQERLNIDVEQAKANREKILAHSTASTNARLAHEQVHSDDGTRDPDLQLYSGGFFSPGDRAKMNSIWQAAPLDSDFQQPPFKDKRLPVMTKRYRARNWPESLSKPEAQAWKDEVIARIEDEQLVATTRKNFAKKTALMAINPDTKDMAQKLLQYQEQLLGIKEVEE